ncbi:MAG TPA: formate dehydrogenase subunit gamma [Candidatus Acidoferrales bacterium]|nr:formate dehydrogenase subunit gamma [Candidatus Acidoferrales bacterium]
MSASRTIPSAEARAGGILRYTFGERLIHWIAAFSYVYDLVTGLSFWSPYLFLGAAAAGGGPTARFWHPWLGVLFAATMVWMYAMWCGDMATSDADRAWWRARRHYIRNEDEKLPAIGRFNYGQKLFFRVMLWGIVLLLLSGVGLWLTDSIPWSLRWLRYLAILVHVIAALATMAGFIIHVYMGTAMVRGSFTSIVSGEVTPAWARMHHRLWYEQVTRPPSTRK